MTLHWHTEPLLLLLICGIGWLYCLAAFTYRHRIAPGAPASIPHAVAFFLGLALVYLAVGSPIDQIGESYLFWVHMLQHLLLMYAAPVALAFGFSRRWVESFSNNPTRERWLRAATHPVLNAAALILIFTAWHVPVLYEAALRNRTLHVLEHATLFLPSLALCFRLVGPNIGFSRLAWPARLLLVFALMVGQIPVFGFLAFTEEALYPTYVWAPRITGLSPIEDQVMGAVVMKVGGMLFALPILAYCFYQWYRESV